EVVQMKLLFTLAFVLSVGCADTKTDQCVDGSHRENGRCVPNSDGGTLNDAGSKPDIFEGFARVTGTVWGPGKKFPVAGALVAAYKTRPENIPEETYCQRCVEIPLGTPYAETGPDGTFDLELAAKRKYFFVVQKGQFRRVTEFDAPPVGEYAVPESYTTFPSMANQSAGDMVPKIALVYGDYDSIQDVLAKAGMGKEDGDYGLLWGSENVSFDVYDNSGPGEESHGQKLENLILDAARLNQYHLVFFACSYNANFSFMENPKAQENLREYVRKGGKLYVSDYAYAVAEMVWPEFIWFTDPLHGGCQEKKFPDGCNHGPPFDAPARSLDQDLSKWLLNVDPTVSSAPDGQATFETKENWDTIGSIAASYVGDDPETGDPINMEPKVWVEGTWNYEIEDVGQTWDWNTYHPMTVSWPFGCGRVLYTTYHTVGNEGRHPGFLTQELILWHLIMELQACQEHRVL
ncbi:MAG: hypothetical protein V1754_02110, partial [Pseudomonadota bacterium]